MEIEVTKTSGVKIITDDNYAALGVTVFLKQHSIGVSCTHPIIFIITQRSRVEAFSFLCRESHFFSLCDLAIIIAPESVRRIIRGLWGVTCAFINVHNSPARIAYEIEDACSSDKVFGDNSPEELTLCEYRVINLLLAGMKPCSIAKTLNLNDKTVSSQKRRVMRKYDVSSTAELVMKHRLIELCSRKMLSERTVMPNHITGECLVLAENNIIPTGGVVSRAF